MVIAPCTNRVGKQGRKDKDVNVLVTGGAGYIGSVLSARLLLMGHRVTVLDNLMYGQESLLPLCGNPGFTFVRGDARDESVLKPLVSRADVIIPLAAIVGAPACDRDPELATSTNLKAIQTINQLRSPDQLLILPNTNSGYGQGGKDPCREDSPQRPVSLYACLKVQAEGEVLGKEGSIALRLATVFGVSPRMRLDLLVNHFVYAAITDGYIVLFEKDARRNYVHIADVADCFIYCIQKWEAMAGRAYNLGLDSANLTKEELARRVRKHVPHFYVHCSPIGSDPDCRDYLVSNQRLREAGFEACRTLDEGIRELLTAYSMIRRSWRNS